MTSNHIREAQIIVAEKIRNGEIASLNEAVIEAAGGALAYVQAAYEAAQRQDVAGLQRNARDASLSGVGLQLEIPGLEHAAVPFWIGRKNAETGEWSGVSPKKASLDEMDVEVSKLERKAALYNRTAGGYRATIDRLRELGIPGDMTGEEIAAKFPKELES